jgi:hypothetical protein
MRASQRVIADLLMEFGGVGDGGYIVPSRRATSHSDFGLTDVALAILRERWQVCGVEVEATRGSPRMPIRSKF